MLLEEGVCSHQCVLLAKLYQSLPCFIPYSKAKFACYSRCFLTSYFCIPVPCNEKDIFLGVSSKRSCRSSQDRSTSASSALLVGAYTWITVILNGLPWKQTDHSVILEIASKYCISDSFVDHDGYCIHLDSSSSVIMICALFCTDGIKIYSKKHRLKILTWEFCPQSYCC